MNFLELGFVAMMMTVTGCSTVGVQAPQSLDEKIAYAVATEAGLRSSAAQALMSGTITVTDAQKILTMTDEVRGALDAARASEKTDTAGAQGKLALAIAVLTEVQNALLAKGVK